MSANHFFYVIALVSLFSAKSWHRVGPYQWSHRKQLRLHHEPINIVFGSGCPIYKQTGYPLFGFWSLLLPLDYLASNHGFTVAWLIMCFVHCFIHPSKTERSRCRKDHYDLRNDETQRKIDTNHFASDINFIITPALANMRRILPRLCSPESIISLVTQVYTWSGRLTLERVVI